MQYKTTLLTGHYENYQPLAEIVRPVFQKYCDKQGYKLECELLRNDVPYGFWKLEYIQWLLKYGNTDLIFCTDLDVLITNHTKKVEDFIDEKHDFYITKDVNGINTGTFIIVDSVWSREFIDMLLLHKDEFENEQTAIDHFRNEDKWKERIKILPHPSINSFPMDHYAPTWGKIGNEAIDRPTHLEGAWEKSDFICHMPGHSLEKRIEVFTKMIEEIIN